MLNSDGAYRISLGQATAGGALRNASNRWLGGFSMQLGACTSYRAELWVVYKGLLLAWELGFKRIIIQVDSLLLVRVITSSNHTHVEILI